MIPGMGGGGSLALNQLLVVMDGIDDPPLTKRVVTNRLNTFLDALYVVPAADRPRAACASRRRSRARRRSTSSGPPTCRSSRSTPR